MSQGAVAADTPDASQAGATVLAEGGNAVDAAIATALALGVVAPSGSGLGGGGFAVVWSAKEHEAKVIDFREVAPAAATREMYASDPPADTQHPSRSIIGGLAVGVPGEPAGLWAMHEALGKLALDRVVAPASKLARGFHPTRRLVQTAAHVGPALGPTDPLRRWLVPDGKPMTTATRVARPQLADTIKRFGKGGRDAFYKGAIAEDLVGAARARGGILTMADLAAYQPLWREPLVGSFRGRQLFAAPPPAGGLTAIEALQFLDALPALPKGSIGDSAYFHRIAEALTHAFADRARWVGDPAFFDVPTAKLASPAYARSLAAKFTEAGTLPIDTYGLPPQKGSPVEPPHDHGTSHICVIDGEGNAVAMTTTVNLELGSQVEGPRSGVVLNDQMDDFAARPGKPNGFGLVGAEANAIAPGKRPVSSMTPMLVVEDGKVLACVGGSGGPTIVASTVEAIVAVIDEGADAETAVASPRIYTQWRPDRVMVERDVPEDVFDALAKRGHKVARTPVGSFAPSAQLILRRGDELEAASDPRKAGAPASFPLEKNATKHGR